MTTSCAASSCDRRPTGGRRGTLSGAGLALDVALRRSVAQLRDSVRHAHELVNAVLREEEQLRAMAAEVALSDVERRRAADPHHRWRTFVRSRLLWALPALASVGAAAALLAAAAGLSRLVGPTRLYLALYRLLASLVWFGCLTLLNEEV